MKMPLTGWPVLGLFLTVFLTAYAPALMASYAFLDDYVWLHSALLGDQAGIIGKIAHGRPLYGLLLDGVVISSNTVRDIGDLRYLRLVGIIGIAVLAWGVFQILGRTGWGHVQSFFISVILCTTLSFQVYAAWAVTAFYPYSALASLFAFALAERAFEAQGRLLKWLIGAGASLALLIALTIYQPTAMFFWVFAAVVLLRPDTPLCDMLRRFGWYCLIALGGMFLGFVVYKLGSSLYLYLGLSARPVLAVQHLPAKVVWFLCEALPNALNFTLLSPAHWFFPEGGPAPSSFHRSVDILIAWGVFIIVVGGLMLYFRGPFKKRLGKLAIAGSLLPLSYAPNLLAAENWAAYRTLSSLTSVVVVYVFFALRGYAQRLHRPPSPFWVNVTIGSIAIASVLSAMYHVQTSFVVPQIRELDVMRLQLAQGNLAQARSIYVIRSRWQDTLAPPARYDEFGLPSSYAAAFVPSSMMFLLLREMAPEHAHLPVVHVAADGPIEPPPGSIVVDMRKLSLLSAAANASTAGIGRPTAAQ